MTSCRLILAGNPNVGKSTVFNALTGLKQHTGNWSGKTVALASGSFHHEDAQFQITDLPGTYSLISNSPEEEIARNAIVFGNGDFTLVVADATCLERNLNLVLQILELTPQVALCVNLMDEAKRKGIRIDTDALSRRLGIPVIGITARNRRDIQRLKQFLCQLTRGAFPTRKLPPPVRYPVFLEDAITTLKPVLPSSASISQRLLALKLLDNPIMATQILDSLSLSALQRTSILSQTEEVKATLSAQGICAVSLRDSIVDAITQTAHETFSACVLVKDANLVPNKWDRILTSRRFGIPIMIGFLGILLWITIQGANFPSQLLLSLFQGFSPHLRTFLDALHLPDFWISLLVDGMYQTVAWVTAVMLPPMAIFFPLFTLLEDLGVLPRLAFNLDRCFQKAGSCGKQALTMCMGLGCNAVGVTGCRILSSRKERFAAMVTNCFIPCNGRFSMLITLSVLFIGGWFSWGSSLVSALFVLLLIAFGILASLGVTSILTRCCFQDEPVTFTLELPPYRPPQIGKTLVRSLFDRTLKILTRAIRVSAPAGAFIWLMANLQLQNGSVLSLCADALNPLASIMGMDGMILLAFLLALPANEIVLPILIMGYLATGQMSEIPNLSALGELLTANGWHSGTAINVMLFSLLHYPCATTLWTIRKESGSTLWMLAGFLIPTAVAVLICMAVNGIFLFFA